MTDLYVALFIIVVLQLAIIAMLQAAFSNRAVKQMGVMLAAVAERNATALHGAIGKGTDAAHAAYEEANTVNQKISDLNARLLHEESKLDTKHYPE